MQRGAVAESRRFVIVPNRRNPYNRNYNIMRALSFRSDELRSLLLRSKIATLDELKQALGTSVDVTVFRKLKPLDYLTSYSHRGRYYTLREIARFDDKGLWSQADRLVLAVRHAAGHRRGVRQSFPARIFRR